MAGAIDRYAVASAGDPMHRSLRWLDGLRTTLLARPDEIMLEVGAGGELLVARVRALISMLCLALPLFGILGGATISHSLVALAATVFINVMAQLWLALARNPRRHGWLPYATGTYDITTTTAVLALLAIGDRAAGLNSMVIWGFYPISIAMTALRNDGRLTLYVSSLALVQYALLVIIVAGTARSPDQLVSVEFGTVSIAAQVDRLMVFVLMGLITTTIVYRIQRLVELSGRDGLTGLPNRLWLSQRMPRIVEDAHVDGRSLTLALLELDRFRRINDEIDTRDSERVLRQIAALFGEMLESDDHLARIGGQEFVLVLHCPVGSAWERIDRLRRALAERPFVAELGSESQRITLSAGLVSCPQDGSNMSTLLRSADRRLQQAKRDGGNRVIARES